MMSFTLSTMTERLMLLSVLAGVLVFPLGCATEEFVREELRKTELKLGQQITETRAVADAANQRGIVTDERLSRSQANRYKRALVRTAVVSFWKDKWELDDPAQAALLDVAQQLRENTTFTVDLEGHTDNLGQLPAMLQLSDRRVESVRRFLTDKGVDLNRLESIGFGQTRPVADNATEQGKALNRRVVLKIYRPID